MLSGVKKVDRKLSLDFELIKISSKRLLGSFDSAGGSVSLEPELKLKPTKKDPFWVSALDN